MAKLGNFLQSHSLRLKLMDKTAAEEARAVFTGREKGGFGGGGGKGGKKEGYEGIIAAAMMMKSMYSDKQNKSFKILFLL